MLTCFERLFLMALDDEEGCFVEALASQSQMALAAGVLAELVLQDRLRLENERLVVINSTPADHPVLDRALFKLIEAARPRKVRYWINTLIFEETGDAIGQSLINQGLLARKKKRLLTTEKAQTGEDSKFAIKQQLREVVLTGQPAGQRQLVQLGLLLQFELLSLIFTRGERKAAQKRVEKLLAEENRRNVGDAVADFLLALARVDI